MEQKNNLNIIHNEITILPEYYNSLQKFVPGICKLNSKYKIIEEIIRNASKRENLTIRKINKIYQKKTGNNLGKSTLYNILTNKLNYK